MDVFMTALAMLVRDRTTIVAVLVALAAGRFTVFAVQRELGLVVVEAQARLILVPTAGVVAGLAGALKLRVLERALVRIGVTALASAEGNPFVASRLFAGSRPVAALACQGLVLPR
jgi:hypothetical protein